MLWTLFSLPLDLFVAALTSLFSLGLLTMPLTGPLIDPLIAPLMLSDSVSIVLGVELAGDHDCRFFLFCCCLLCVVSFCDCITDRRKRFADSLETASLSLNARFGEASVNLDRSGLQALRALMRMRPGGVRRGWKKSRLLKLRAERCDCSD
jgi:hypothetical protein